METEGSLQHSQEPANFYGEELLASHPNPKLKDPPLGRGKPKMRWIDH
jgi:hypothetical protein